MTRDGAEVKLGAKEFAILQELVVHTGKMLTHRHLFRAVWGQDDGDQTSLRVFFRPLRVKLENDPARPSHLLTEAGAGCRLVGRPGWESVFRRPTYFRGWLRSALSVRPHLTRS